MARVLLFSTALQSATMALALTAHSQPAPNAQPMGGSVVAGGAAISHTSSDTRINQATQRAAINWQSFNVGSRQSVTFAQPSSSAMTLNRVIGPDPSQIAGRIDANGQVVLVNQSGVTFFRGAQVNTNGLMVSAAGISNANFMAGVMKFDQPARPNARIVNQGDITIGKAGLAALVAPQVSNAGTIAAKLGHVVLAGAKTATLDLYGDGLLSLDVNNQVTQAPSGATALVTNTGTVIADGGTVQLTARAADGVVQNLVAAGGTIRAATVGNRAGVIALDGIGGSIVVEGQLAAPGTVGGTIEVASSGDVNIASSARIDASGKAGGGVIAIGTDIARAVGGPSVTPTKLASNVIVQHGATIAADAIINGNGGHVTVLSADTTDIGGVITAKGGARGGNGGLVETSGTNLGVTGSVDASAAFGNAGTWLLDPVFLNVVSGPPPTGSEDGDFSETGTVLASDGLTGTPDTISNGTINSSTFNVVLQAQQTLTVAANIDLVATSGLNLTLQAGGTLTVLPGIDVTASGNVTLATGGAGPAAPPGQASPLILIEGPISSTGGTLSLLSGSGGTINIGPGGAVSATGITLNSGSGGISLTGGAALGGAGSAIDITSLGPVAAAATSTITAVSLSSRGGVTGSVDLLGTANAITALGNFAVTGGDLTVVNGGNLTLAGNQSANNLFYELATAGGTLTLGTVSFVSPSVPAILTAASGGRISLVADNYAVVNPTSSITTTAGTIEFAPFSPIAESLLGASGLVVNAALLSITQTNGGILELGGFTNVAADAAAPAASASSIDIAGVANLTTLASTLRLDSTGAITESGGPLTVATLLGNGGTWTLNNAANAIATLGDITGTSFSLNNSVNLLVGDTIDAADVAIRAPASQVSLGDGASIVTGGIAPPAGPLQSALEPANGAPGAYIQAAGFTQSGSSSLIGQSGGPATLQIATTGNVQFDPPLGLQGNGAWLILDLTNGTAAGNVFVNALDVAYTVPGAANLFGTIAGIAGVPAAALGVIQPAINNQYLFNGCVIGTTCGGVVATTPIPIPTQTSTPLPTPTPASPTLSPPITVATATTVQSDSLLTATLGGLYTFLPGMPPPLIGLPDLVVVALPLLPAPARRLTNPDVVPPNITYLDY